METVEPFHPVTYTTWKCCSSSSDNDDNNDSNDDNGGRHEGVREGDEVEKYQKEKKKEKICLIFIKQSCIISIHI